MKSTINGKRKEKMSKGKNISKRMMSLLAVGAVCLPGTMVAQDANLGEAVRQLQQQMKRLQEENRELKQELSTVKEGAPAPDDDDRMGRDLLGKDFLKSKGLSIGFYGEAKYRVPERGAHKFDPHRFVLTPSYQMADWLIFNSELELEHGGVDETAGTTGTGGTSRSKFDGELELEQFYGDILINDHFNLRSPGVHLIPVGRVNLTHEPTTFYSTERPELNREIIPSTWFEGALGGVWGKIVDGLDYSLVVSAGMEDSIGNGTAGVTGNGGFRSARPRLRRSSDHNLAYSGRLHYSGLKGLDASTSFYVTKLEGTTGTGAPTGDSVVSLWDIEAQYMVPKTKGLELRGEFAWWNISDPQNLTANNNNTAATSFTGTGIVNDDVGEQMYGWYLEAAYHFWPEAWRHGKGEFMDLVPFVRYTDIVTQSQLLPGSTAVDNGSRNKDFLTFGLSYFLNQNFVLKADYRRNLNGSTASTGGSGTNQDYFQLGAGMFF